MTRVAIKAPDEKAWRALRTLDVTSTESAALYGESPYDTEFALWHRKREGRESEIGSNERMEWGTDLQDSIALSFARRYCVKVERIADYMRIETSRMGASFDFEIYEPAQPFGSGAWNQIIENLQRLGPGLLEIKNVDRSVFFGDWKKNDDGSIEAPSHIEIQLQHQLHVRERAWGAIGVLIGGNTGKLIVRERMLDVGHAIEARIQEFWKSIAVGIEPAAVFPDDAETIRKLRGYAEPNKVFDGRGNEDIERLAIDYQDAALREKKAAEDKKVAQAKILQIIGEAESAYTNGFNISASMVAEATIPSYVRKGYRNFRVTKKPQRVKQEGSNGPTS